MKKTIRLGTAIMLIILAAAAAVNVSVLAMWNSFNRKLGNLEEERAAYKKFAEVKEYVENNFVGEIDEEALMDGAMKGYITALNDRWSSYLTEEEFTYLKNSFNNTYTGVGTSVVYDEELSVLVVVQVYDNSPAAEAGLQSGDYITGVEGYSVQEIGYAAMVDKIRGEEGSPVTVDVMHAATGQTEKVTMTRRSVLIDAVSAEMLNGNIGYIRIENFDAGVDRAFEEKLNRLIADGACGIVFDVRYNPGGEASVMISMLDRLLPEGVIFSMKNKEGAGEEYRSDAGEIDLPMAVIVNRYSYSAAEFFAAALQEYGKAVIVGEKTTGKGYAQQTIPLSDGSGLYLSTYTYYTPEGRNLAGVGVTPDVEALLADELAAHFASLSPEEDTQLQIAAAQVRPAASAGQIAEIPAEEDTGALEKQPAA